MKRHTTRFSIHNHLRPPNSVWLLGAGALCAFSMTAFAWRKCSPELAIAPGAPGRTPHWTPSAKQGVGTSLGPQSNVWFTLYHGLVRKPPSLVATSDGLVRAKRAVLSAA